MAIELRIGRITVGEPGQPGYRVIKEDTCDFCGNVLDFMELMVGHECEENSGTI